MFTALHDRGCTDQSGHDCFILCPLHDCCNAPSLAASVLANLAMIASSYACFTTAALLQGSAMFTVFTDSLMNLSS